MPSVQLLFSGQSPMFSHRIKHAPSTQDSPCPTRQSSSSSHGGRTHWPSRQIFPPAHSLSCKQTGGGATFTQLPSKQISSPSQSVSTAHSGRTSSHWPRTHAKFSSQSRLTRHSGGLGKQRPSWQVSPSSHSPFAAHARGGTQLVSPPRVQIARSWAKPPLRPRSLRIANQVLSSTSVCHARTLSVVGITARSTYRYTHGREAHALIDAVVPRDIIVRVRPVIIVSRVLKHLVRLTHGEHRPVGRASWTTTQHCIIAITHAFDVRQ